MTYCVGLSLREGLVLLADTRTNAGLDNIATFSKLYTAAVPGDRVLGLLSAGNLAVTQSVWNRLQEGVLLDGTVHTLLSVPSMFRAAQLVGAAIRAAWTADGPAMQAQGVAFDVSMILGGQIAGGPPRLYLVYAAGNFIEATPDTPFLQIGEHKYGKPILDRALTWENAADGCDQTRPGVDGQHAALQRHRRHAARSDGHPRRHPAHRAAPAHHRRRHLFPYPARGLERGAARGLPRPAAAGLADVLIHLGRSEAAAQRQRQQRQQRAGRTQPPRISGVQTAAGENTSPAARTRPIPAPARLYRIVAGRMPMTVVAT